MVGPIREGRMRTTKNPVLLESMRRPNLSCDRSAAWLNDFCQTYDQSNKRAGPLKNTIFFSFVKYFRCKKKKPVFEKTGGRVKSSQVRHLYLACGCRRLNPKRKF